MSNNKTKIILVEPQMGENIGAAARIMTNFNLDDLVIVNPKQGWPNEKAIAMAAHGACILDKARVVSNFSGSLEGVDFLIATAATGRDIEKPVITSHDLPLYLKDKKNVAIMFGCEKSGLNNEHLSYADVILNIPTGNNHSLNLAQAVAIVSYELSKNACLEAIEFVKSEVASKSDLDNMLVHFYKVLDEKGYYKNPKMRPNMELNLRNLFTKASMTEQEIRTIRGIISLLEKGY